MQLTADIWFAIIDLNPRTWNTLARAIPGFSAQWLVEAKKRYAGILYYSVTIAGVIRLGHPKVLVSDPIPYGYKLPTVGGVVHTSPDGWYMRDDELKIVVFVNYGKLSRKNGCAMKFVDNGPSCKRTCRIYADGRTITRTNGPAVRYRAWCRYSWTSLSIYVRDGVVIRVNSKCVCSHLKVHVANLTRNQQLQYVRSSYKYDHTANSRELVKLKHIRTDILDDDIIAYLAREVTDILTDFINCMDHMHQISMIAHRC